jgi:hypothetical protein
MQCKCGSEIHPKRSELGYKICVDCSTEERKAVIQISNHKTGNEIQIVDQATAEEFNFLASRTSFGVSTGLRKSFNKK